MLKKDKKAEWRRMEQWLKSIKPKNKLIGIGGNIRSFLQLQDKKELSLKQFKRKSKELANYTTEEKILRYGFSPDRADVIDHSLEIYDVICTNLEIEKITSTKWGISDSIAVKLFHEIYSGKVEIS